jgi:hypothetical protein
MAAMLAIVLGGVIYAAGQIMGAETRARANVWATACLVGAIIAVMMAVVGPGVLRIIYGQELTCGTSSPAPTTCGGSTCNSPKVCLSDHCCPEGSVAYCTDGCCNDQCKPSGFCRKNPNLEQMLGEWAFASGANPVFPLL